jgi:hypothetical protein
MSEPSVYDIHAPKLAAKGYHPLPIRGKVPAVYVPSFGELRNMPDWCNPRRPIETSPQPGAGVGIRLGLQACGIYLVAIDWDDESIAIAALDKFPAAIMKEGRRGFTAFYRSDRPIASRDFRINGRVVMQILSDGRQTVLPPTIHPETARPYVWSSQHSLFDLGAGELPEIRQ